LYVRTRERSFFYCWLLLSFWSAAFARLRSIGPLVDPATAPLPCIQVGGARGSYLGWVPGRAADVLVVPAASSDADDRSESASVADK